MAISQPLVKDFAQIPNRQFGKAQVLPPSTKEPSSRLHPSEKKQNLKFEMYRRIRKEANFRTKLSYFQKNKAGRFNHYILY